MDIPYTGWMMRFVSVCFIQWYYIILQGAGETLQCPRCSASVPVNPGVCNNCGENVFQVNFKKFTGWLLRDDYKHWSLRDASKPYSDYKTLNLKFLWATRFLNKSDHFISFVMAIHLVIREINRNIFLSY